MGENVLLPTLLVELTSSVREVVYIVGNSQCSFYNLNLLMFDAILMLLIQLFFICIRLFVQLLSPDLTALIQQQKLVLRFHMYVCNHLFYGVHSASLLFVFVNTVGFLFNFFHHITRFADCWATFHSSLWHLSFRATSILNFICTFNDVLESQKTYIFSV